MRLAALGLLVGAVELTVVLLTRLHLRVRHQRQVPSTKSMAPSRAASFRWTAVTGVAVIGAAVVATIGAPGASGTGEGGRQPTRRNAIRLHCQIFLFKKYFNRAPLSW